MLSEFKEQAAGQCRNLAVIGGGATGVTYVIQLAKALAEENARLDGVRLHLIDPRGFGNGGIAYGQSDNTYLNEPADAMSPWDRQAFTKFCKKKGLGDNPKTFHLRSVYGEFLNAEYRQAVSALQSRGLEIVEHKRKGDLKCVDDSTYQVLVDETPLPCEFNVDDILIATGHGSRETLKDLEAYDGYIHSIYPISNLRDNPSFNKPDANILILGTGPGFIDTIMQIDPHTFTGKITAISGSAFVPQKRDLSLEVNPQPYKPAIQITQLDETTTADNLAAIIAQELERAASEQGIPERQAAYAIQKNLETYLKKLTPAEQKIFVEEHKNTLLHKATPIPDFSHDRFETLRKTGRLTIEKAVLTSAKAVAPIENGLRTLLWMQDWDYQETPHFDFDCIVNCTGHNPLNNPLVKSLIDRGLAECDENLKILETDETGYRLTGSGIPCVGPQTNLGVDGVETFAAPLADITKSIVDRHASRSIVPVAFVQNTLQGGQLAAHL